jgi:hypothetical protein
LEENDLKEYVEVVVASPIDPQELEAHEEGSEGQAGVARICKGSLDSTHC